MGFFDKKTTKNTVTNDYAYDQSTTVVDNTVDNSDRSLTFEDHADNSFRVDQVDNSDNSIDYSDSSQSSLSDYSDNSFSAHLVDMSGSSNSGNSTTSTSNTTNITDGGAFSLVNNLISKVLDSNVKMIDLVGLNSKAAMQSANDLASKGIDGAFSIKAGEQVAFGSAKTQSEMMSTVFKVAAVAGAAFVASKVFKR